MKIVDCTWEKENIGSKVLEIDIEKNDKTISEVVGQYKGLYDYIVVKVPANMTSFNWELGGMGFTMIETQIKYSFLYKDFNFNEPYVRAILPKISYKRVETESDLDDILDNITPDMFITDRISLDPKYGFKAGCHRYKNYVANSFIQNKGEIIQILFKEKNIGLQMFEIKDEVCFGKLGGIYSNVNIPGIGMLVVCTPLFYTHDRYGINKFIPDISSNNIPVLGLYNYLHAKFEGLQYVFVKHF